MDFLDASGESGSLWEVLSIGLIHDLRKLLLAWVAARPGGPVLVPHLKSLGGTDDRVGGLLA